jgi:hypothetical protein
MSRLHSQPTDPPWRCCPPIRQTGPSLVRFVPPHGPPQQEITGVEPLHEQVIRLLGPYCEIRYECSA